MRPTEWILLSLAAVMVPSGPLWFRTPQWNARHTGWDELERAAVRSRETELATLGEYIAQRRGAILQAWRKAVTADPTLTTGASLPRDQLHDHIPALLVNFEQRLAAGSTAKPQDVKNAKSVQKGDAAAHGLHRWQQGFDLAEVARELSKLNECLVIELDSYSVAHPELDPTVMPSARALAYR